MKIYTKGGDQGKTDLFGGGRVVKSDPRVNAYGEVDELNAAIGAARSLGTAALADLDTLLGPIQEQLFAVGAVLATPAAAKSQGALPPLEDAWVTALEQAIDRWDGELAKLTAFVLPGGSPLAASLHLARTVCRRAERAVVDIAVSHAIDPKVVVYLNRLSDFLFVAARVANHRAKVPEVLWLGKKQG
jgi:cob(I)alamin adenosyltransferase